MIFSFDPVTGKIMYMNHAFRFFMGFQNVPEDINQFLAHVQPEDRDLITKRLRQIKEVPFEKKVVKFSVSGNVRHLKLTLYQSSSTEIPKIIGFAEDYTDEVEFQQNLLRHNAKKNAILNILSHDIAGSFATLRNLADLALGNIKNGDLDPLEGTLSAINDICLSNMSLIRSFLKKEFITSLSVPINLEREDVVKVMRNFLDQFVKMRPQLGIDIRFVTDIPRIFMEIDGDKLIQVMNNLISNSLKFTPRGGTICVSITDLVDKVTISVRDTGIGIPEHMKPQVFSKFNDHKRQGLNNESPNGIGLWAVKTIVEWMGGTIDFESAEGEGSEFILMIPKGPAKVEIPR